MKSDNNWLSVSPSQRLPVQSASITTGIIGVRGSGKTNTAGVLAEELLALGLQTVIIDPTDAWWGMRSGFPIFIFGGHKGDIELREGDGKVIAEFVVKERISVILSLRHLRKGAQRRFVRDFCEELYHLKGEPKNRSPLTVFIDEAPLFVPQKVMGDMAFVVGAVEDLIARGRNVGFGVVLISQRSATINKDVLTQCDILIAHRLPSPQDRKALQPWVEDNASLEQFEVFSENLANQEDGQAWIWAPRFRIFKQVAIRKRHTFDSSATPEIGKELRAPKRLQNIDLGALKGRLAEVIEERRKDDPAALKARIAELERQATKVQPAAQPATSDIKELERAYSVGWDACKQYLSGSVGAVKFNLDALLRLMSGEQLAPRTRDLLPVSSKVKQPAKSSVVGVNSQLNFLAGANKPTTPPAAAGSANNAMGSGALKRMMIALAQRRSQGLTRAQIAVRSGLKQSGSFRTHLSTMRRNEWIIDGSGGRIFPTDEGIQALGDFTPLPAGQELLAYWIHQFGASKLADMLRVVSEAYPKGVDKIALAERIGMTFNGSFRTYLSKLRSLELIQGKDELVASEEFFN